MKLNFFWWYNDCYFTVQVHFNQTRNYCFNIGATVTQFFGQTLVNWFFNRNGGVLGCHDLMLYNTLIKD